MVEEGGVEPPFFPNFTMQLSCCPAKTLAIKSRPASPRPYQQEGLISKKAYQQEGFFTFLLFYLFTFNPFPCALHSSYLQVAGKRCPARSLILFFTLKT